MTNINFFILGNNNMLIVNSCVLNIIVLISLYKGGICK